MRSGPVTSWKTLPSGDPNAVAEEPSVERSRRDARDYSSAQHGNSPLDDCSKHRIATPNWIEPDQFFCCYDAPLFAVIKRVAVG